MYYENFRHCSLKLEESEINNYLSIYDIKDFQRPFKTLYGSVDEYIERQFHILREDCFYHLKQVIMTIKKDNIRNVGNLPKDCGVWRYKEVEFLDLSIGLFDIAYSIKFQTVGNVDWNETKQMRYGSLLCLSYDNFRSFILATVTDSNIKDLKNGNVNIHLIDSPLIIGNNKARRFQMLETQAYYESYFHVLARLQNFTESTFPFPNYFLKGRKDVCMVKYLQNRIPVVSSKHHMDESQRIAFETALTDSISLIQGPPGTGKTTIGFYIIEKLLKRYKCKYNLSEPILVVCYTNHALDQFLEKIQAICSPGEIIRIGSKSESEKLKGANISEFVNEWKQAKRFPKYMAVRRAKLREALNELKSNLLDENVSEVAKLSDAMEYESLLIEFRKCGMDEHLMVMRTAKVIGMTTTACARYADVLSDLGCKIVIVEEAAEVLEAHVICSLNSSCEQLIMIGDHQQLQPTSAVKEFESVYDLNISLFERLIKNGFKQVTLTTQRRMRPEISRCIAPIYPNLIDHPSVKTYPDVEGMRTNMYMYNHCYLESLIFETSYKNIFEVSVVKGFCDYLLSEGVNGERITVITTYRGQKYCIRQAMKEEKYKSIGVFVVDGYQGEENDIIILSLVRSNFDGFIGFLKKPNRICVALSRARRGFYIVGNMTCLKSRSALWSQISSIIGSNQGTKIPVVCRRNSGHRPFIETVEDFTDEKRCKGVCGIKFPCGEHVCKETCHPGPHTRCMNLVEKQCLRKQHRTRIACSDRLECVIIVISTLSCGHNCEHACHNVALTCRETVDISLPCLHTQRGPCGTSPKDVVCQKRYKQTLKCGHVYVDCNVYTKDCDYDVTYVRKCGHKKPIKCHQRKLEDTLDCQEKVNVILSCSHSQGVMCGTDISGVVCVRRKKYTMSCGHEYVDCVVFTGLCYRDLVLERPCGHNKTVKCHESVQQGKLKCVEMVTLRLSCDHDLIAVCGTRACDVECSRRFSQLLSCGHQIISCTPFTGHCQVSVKQKLTCGHTKEIKCFDRNHTHQCIDICLSMLSCGHNCLSSCDDCFSGRLHMPCQKMCPRKLFCGHHCKDKCHTGDCKECKNDCLLTSMAKLFVTKVKVKQPILKWIHLSKSVNKRSMDSIFQNIIEHLKKLEKLSAAEISNLSLSYVCFEKVVTFANEVFGGSEFGDDLIVYIDYIDSVVHRIFWWLNPCQRTFTKDCVEQLDLELFRLKDLYAMCLHIELNKDVNGVRELLEEIKSAVYNLKTKEKLREKISLSI